jgi:predicted nucleic acid-binding Zn ribbon protein
MRERRAERRRGSRWEIQRERCRTGSDAAAPAAAPDPVGAVIARVMGKLGVAGEFGADELTEVWPEIVGPVVAAHARPGRVARGEVLVFVDSSVWLFELRRSWHARILERLKLRLGPERARSLRFTIDPDLSS